MNGWPQLANRWTTLWATILVNTGVAIMFTALLSISSASFTWRDTLRAFLEPWIFANCIGLLANLVPWAALSRCDRPQPGMWVVRIAIFIAAGVLGSLAACGIFVLAGWVTAGGFWAYYRESVKAAILITMVIGTGIHLYAQVRARLAETTLQLRTKELERERALKLATEAQLASLESRLHPHFLFNTLNSISSLIPDDPHKAERLVGEMAALLRFSLESAHLGAVPIAREMQIVSGYLEIEKARLGERLAYQVSFDPATDGVDVPPLAIQTLVENSIKHVIAPNRAGGSVNVSVARNRDTVEVTVEDTGAGFDLDAAPAGHGLDNLRSRLATLYGEQAHLAVSRNGAGAEIRLSIPVRQAPREQATARAGA